MDIEQLVTWSLRDQGTGWDSSGKDSALSKLAAQGTMVDEGGVVASPSMALLTDPDAMVVRNAIDRLPAGERVLVIQYGRAGLRPEGADEALGEPEPLRDKRGRQRWDYAVPGNRRSERRPLYDLLGFSQRRESIQFARAQWTLWRGGLVALVPLVNAGVNEGGMWSRKATGPRAPECPWDLPAPVVHGMEAAEASSEPQPWMRPDRDAERARRRHAGRSIEEMRAAAVAVPLALPTLWGTGPRGVVVATAGRGSVRGGARDAEGTRLDGEAER